MVETFWAILLVLVVLAAVLGPVATLRYLAVLERGRSAHRKVDQDPDGKQSGHGSPPPD